jgi:hypothetical protein
MADTLEEIYKATLSASDFDSNGVKTIITTDSSTRYVLKDVQVESSEAKVPIKANLLVNDMNVANIDSSVTGSEIVGPSSTVKIDTSTYPLVYTDNYYQVINSSGSLERNASASIAGIEETTLTNLKSTRTPITSISDYEYLGYWEGIGPNNAALKILFDNNSTTHYYTYNSSGTLVASETTAYTPKAFDGYRYVYYFPSGSVMKKHDIWTNTTTDINASIGSGGPSTYPRLMYAGNNLYFGWKNYTSADVARAPFIFDSSKNTFTAMTNGNTANTQFSLNSETTWCTSDTSGNIYMARVNNDSNWNVYKINATGTASSVGGLSMSGFQMQNAGQWCSGSSDGKIYFATSSGTVAYYDSSAHSMNNTTITFNNAGSYLGSRGHLTIGTETPSASTIAARTYTLDPQVTYRVTGIKTV